MIILNHTTVSYYEHKKKSHSVALTVVLNQVGPAQETAMPLGVVTESSL